MHDTNKMAVSATLHCLTGCAIGEVGGLVIGTALGLPNLTTTILAVALAFFFGYLLSTLPLVKAGMAFGAALTVVLAADTLSIATMELVDNVVMYLIPGAMGAGLVNPIFWVSMPLALMAAFFAALPVNKYMLKRGKGHALLMKHHEHHGHGHHEDTTTKPLLFGLIGFFAAGLLVSVMATSFDLDRHDQIKSMSQIER